MVQVRIEFHDGCEWVAFEAVQELRYRGACGDPSERVSDLEEHGPCGDDGEFFLGSDLGSARVPPVSGV